MHETNTYKRFKDKPRDNSPEYIIVHHTGGTVANPLADTSHHTAEGIEKGHMAPPNNFEGLGYQYVIHKNGDVWKGRPEHYHGAHTTNYNKKSIGICLSGNFDATLPTKEQENALKSLVVDIQVRYNIPLEKIVPHRTFAVKSCYGRKLADDWARKLVAVTEEMVALTVPKSRLAKIQEFLAKIP